MRSPGKARRGYLPATPTGQRFTASPEAFAPQYGGYCSNQMSLGNLSDIGTKV